MRAQTVILTILLITIVFLSACSQEKVIEQPKIVKERLSVSEIIELRNNYEVIVNDWESTGWESHYNPNVDRNTENFWTRLELTIRNNNVEKSLEWLTVRVNIKHPPGSDGIGLSWGRLPINVKGINPGESKKIITYYPGDLSAVTTMQEVYITISESVDPEDHIFFKELK